MNRGLNFNVFDNAYISYRFAYLLPFPPPAVMIMVRRIMCMEGLFHRDMLPPPPPVGSGLW